MAGDAKKRVSRAPLSGTRDGQPECRERSKKPTPRKLSGTQAVLTSAGTRPFNDDEMDEFIREAHAETVDGVECISLERFRAMECWHLPQLPVVLETRKQASRKHLPQSLPLDLPLGKAEGSPEVTATDADLAAEQSHTLASLSEPLATPKKPGNSPRQTL